tara:strand:+ start:1831 stop:2118 length:288 start_codon:yes stop_codon:yes gene_type:complete
MGKKIKQIDQLKNEFIDRLKKRGASDKMIHEYTGGQCNSFDYYKDISCAINGVYYGCTFMLSKKRKVFRFNYGLEGIAEGHAFSVKEFRKILNLI